MTNVIGNNIFYDWEISLMVWLQAHLGTAGAEIASFITLFGEELACVAVIGFLYFCYDKRFGRYVGLNMIFGFTLNTVIKNIILRRRPYFDHAEIKCLKPVDPKADLYDISAQEFSFPSGHAVNTTLIYGSIARWTGKTLFKVIAVLIPLFVGISRFALGVHYPTDVIGGWILGLAVLLFVPWLEDRVRDKRVFYGILVLMVLPGLFFCRTQDYFTGLGMLCGFILGLLFEEKYVHFENTRKPLRCVLRILGSLALFFGLNELLKLPFSAEFLGSGTFLANAVRTLRYGVILFIMIGVYPMVFKRESPTQ